MPGGDGKITDPFQISNGAQLSYLASIVNNRIETSKYNSRANYYKLTADIYLNDTTDWEKWSTANPAKNEWTAIGTFDNCFYANFDGNGFRVKGIYINKNGTDQSSQYQGLFGYIREATVKNLGIEQSFISAYSSIGGVTGFAYVNVSITNCFFSGNIIGSNSGGIAGGLSKDSIISDCYNLGSISSGTYNVINGGIAGSIMTGSKIKNSYNKGNIHSNLSDTGGIAGSILSSEIDNCYNTGDISGENRVGGVVGEIVINSSIINCYNKGNVSGIWGTGGVLGYMFNNISNEIYPNNLINCYNFGRVTGPGYVGGILGMTQGDGIYTIANCYNTGNILSNSSSVGSIVGSLNKGLVSNCYFLTRTSNTGIGIIGQGIGEKIFAFDTSGSFTDGNTVELAGIKAGDVCSALNLWAAVNKTEELGFLCYESTGETAGEMYRFTKNKYYILSFNLNGGGGAVPDSQLVSEVNFAIKPSDPQRSGYTFEGWYKEAKCQNYWDFAKDKMSVNAMLYAKWSINSPVITDVSDNIAKVYDKSSSTLSIAVQINPAYNYSYQWYKKVADEYKIISGNTSASIMLTNVLESGEYRAVVTVSDGTLSSESYKDFSVTIIKQNYTPIAPVTINVNTYGTALSGWTLNGDNMGVWIWQDDKHIPGVLGNSTAVFILADTDNYTVINGVRAVSVQVTPKNISVVNTAVNDKVYDGTVNANFTNTPALNGIIIGDNVSLVNGVPSFATKDAGVNKSIIFSNFSLSGASSGNYVLVQPTGVTATINRAEGSGSVSLAGWKSGAQASEPVIISETNGIDNVRYEYKKQGAADSEYTTEKPKKAGKYIIRVIFSETQNYKSIEATAEFEILPMLSTGAIIGIAAGGAAVIFAVIFIVFRKKKKAI